MAQLILNGSVVGGVESVNTKQGKVTLTAGDVGAQAALNRSVSVKDDGTGSVTDTGGALAIPVGVTTTAAAASATQVPAGTAALRVVVQTLINNVAHVLANFQAKLNRTVQVNLGSTAAATDTGANITPGVTGQLPISSGGTGKATAADALTALGGIAGGTAVLKVEVVAALPATPVATTMYLVTG